jgi:hypothetical protein
VLPAVALLFMEEKESICSEKSNYFIHQHAIPAKAKLPIITAHLFRPSNTILSESL